MQRNPGLIAIAFLLSVGTGVTLYSQNAASPPAGGTATPAAPAILTVEQRLANLEAALTKLVGDVGTISGARTSLAQHQERRFNDLERKLDDLISGVSRVQNDVKRLER